MEVFFSETLIFLCNLASKLLWLWVSLWVLSVFLPLGIQTWWCYGLHNEYPIFFQSQSSVFVTSLVKDIYFIVFFIAYINPKWLGHWVTRVSVVISDVAFMSSLSVVHSLWWISNIFLVATFVCQAIDAIFILAVEIPHLILYVTWSLVTVLV